MGGTLVISVDKGNLVESTEFPKQVHEVVAQAKALNITSAELYTQAVDLLLGVKELAKKVDASYDPIISAAKQAYDTARTKKAEVKGPLLEAEKVYKDKVAVYLSEEEEKRKKAEADAAEALKAQQQEEDLEHAAALEAAGDRESAEAVLAISMSAPAPAVTLAPTVPKIAGVSKAELWSAEVFDLDALIKAVAAGDVPAMALLPNMTFLNGQARLMKKLLNYPGVRTVSKSSIRAGKTP